jgi:hypothetical protein
MPGISWRTTRPPKAGGIHDPGHGRSVTTQHREGRTQILLHFVH